MAAAIVLILLIPSSCEREGKLYTPDAVRRVVQRMRLGSSQLGAGLREGTSKRLGRVFGGTVAEPPSHGSQGSREGSVERSRGGTKGGSRSLNLTALGTNRPTTRSTTTAKAANGNHQGPGNNQSQPKSNRDSGLFGIPGPLPREEDDDDDYWEYYDE